MIVIAQSGLDPSFVTDSTTLLYVAAVAAAAVRVYKFLRAEDRAAQEVADTRLDNLRTNVSRLTVYAGHLSRMIPVDVEQPPFPELLPELHQKENPR